MRCVASSHNDDRSCRTTLPADLSIKEEPDDGKQTYLGCWQIKEIRDDKDCKYTPDILHQWTDMPKNGRYWGSYTLSR